MTAVLVDPDIELVDFDLADTLDGRAQMILQRIGRDTEENIEQPVVTDDRQKRLFVVQRIARITSGVASGTAIVTSSAFGTILLSLTKLNR